MFKQLTLEDITPKTYPYFAQQVWKGYGPSFEEFQGMSYKQDFISNYNQQMAQILERLESGRGRTGFETQIPMIGKQIQETPEWALTAPKEEAMRQLYERTKSSYAYSGAELPSVLQEYFKPYTQKPLATITEAPKNWITELEKQQYWGAPIKFAGEETQYIRIGGGKELKALRTPEELHKAEAMGPVSKPFTELPATAKSQFTMGGYFYPEEKPKEVLPKAEEAALATGTVAPEIPIPAAGKVMETYTTSLLEDLEKKRTTLNTMIQKQLDTITTDKTNLETKITEQETKMKGFLDTEIKTATTPFREKLEEAERKRLKVEENYFANQDSIAELETLLTESMAEIKSLKQEQLPMAAINRKVAKKQEDIAARTGVIRAVMAVRNNQINVANNLIDRSIEAIRADRQDQLNYYNALYKFYSTQKDEAGKKLVILDTKEAGYIKDQISLLEYDLKKSQEGVDYIKKMMIDPATADIVERAGVVLTDSLSEIQKKFSDYAYKEEVRTQDNKMEEAGYEYVPLPEMLATLDKTRLKMVETSRGDKRQYYKKAIAAEMIKPEIKTAEGYFYKYNPETGEMEPIGGPGKPPEEPEKPKTFLTDTNYRELLIRGVSRDVADAIMMSLSEGLSLEQIRQGLATIYGQEQGYRYLDIIIPYLQDLEKKKSAGVFKLVPTEGG